MDIWSNAKQGDPGKVLSNLCSNGFRFDGMVCGSMEGFLQSLKADMLHERQERQEDDFNRLANRPDSLVEGECYRPAVSGFLQFR